MNTERKNLPIGIFDSGVGGLSVLRTALRLLPGERFIYYGDIANAPYGTKSEEEVRACADRVAKQLLDQGVKALVIACNTATCAAAAQLREKYPQLIIIGMEPAVKLALNQDDTHRVLVAATPITIRGNKLKCLVEHYDGHHLVDLLPLPGLVRFAEKGIYSGAQVHAYLSEQLAEFNLEDYAAFVLGCTHFNLFKQELRTLLPPQMHFVDGNAGTVRQLIRRTVDLPATHTSTPGVTYFASGRPITDPAQLQFIQNVLAHLEKMYPIE